MRTGSNASMSRLALTEFARNLAAGARLACLLPVRRLDFRIGVGSLVVLLLLSAVLDIGLDTVRAADDAVFSWQGVSAETYSAGALLFVSALVSLLLRQRTLLLALPTIVFAAYPTLQVARGILLIVPGASDLRAALTAWQDDALFAWTVLVFVRAAAVALAEVPARVAVQRSPTSDPPARTRAWPRRWLRTGLVAAALLAPLWFGPVFAPDAPWWRPAGVDADPDYPNPASEPVIDAQRVLFDEALAGLADSRAGVTDLYFVAMAASESDALRSDVLSAQEVMDERWATDGRSVALVNHRASLLEQPMASVTNLREALAEIAQVIDADEDVVMLYVAGNGAPGGAVDVALPPYDLVPLTPAGVRRLLDDAGIRWRIVVVTACYAGAWLTALADDHTLVLTATAGGGAGAGCAVSEGGTAFGSALFGAGLTEADTMEGAFAAARRSIGEHALGDAASLPQMAVGEAMAGKLRELERGRAARRASRSV